VWWLKGRGFNFFEDNFRYLRDIFLETRTNMSTKSRNDNQSVKVNLKAPWHLFLVAILFLLIYSIGAYDYIQIQNHNLEYINSIKSKGNLVDYFSNYPAVFNILWTINVFGGIAAALMLLLRTKWVVWVALAVLISKLILDGSTFLFRDRWEIFGPQLALTDIAVLVISAGFFFYCRRMMRGGFLR
jgi:hypothetical protein